MDYWHRQWACPFFRWDEQLKLHCEGCHVTFPDKEAAVKFFDVRCASLQGYKTCEVAKMLEDHYLRTEGQNNDKKR